MLINDPQLTLLFLDFDGVLHPALPYFDERDPNAPHFRDLPALEAVLRAHPHVGVVISSSWRRGRSRADLLARFSSDIRRTRVLDVTPDLKVGWGPGSRQIEVDAWREAMAPEAPWVALDDEPALFTPGACVVVTRDGFGPDDAVALTQALADPVGYARAHPIG